MSWIDAKEKLPSNGQIVIAYGKNEIDLKKDVWLVTFHEEVLENMDGEEKVRLNQYWEKTNGYDVDEVTHWMPLPKPPKE